MLRVFQSKRAIIAVLTLLTSVLATRVGAEDYEAASEREDQAHDAYYRGLVRLGRNATDAQKTKLWQDTLFSAKAESGRAMTEVFGSARNSIMKDVASYYGTELEEKIPSWLSHLARIAGVEVSTAGNADRTAAAAGATGATMPSGIPAPTPTQEPTAALDVSTVEREFTFPKKPGSKSSLPGAKASPEPSPAAAPDFVEVSPDHSDGVQSFSFPGPDPSPKPKPAQKKR